LIAPLLSDPVRDVRLAAASVLSDARAQDVEFKGSEYLKLACQLLIKLTPPIPAMRILLYFTR
jgi:HEAT repeat protein